MSRLLIILISFVPFSLKCPAHPKDRINLFCTDEKGKNYILKEFGFVPATSNIETDSLNKLSADVAKAAASGKTLIWSFNDWGMGIDTDLAPVTQRFFTTPGMSGIDFVNALDDAFQAFLKK